MDLVGYLETLPKAAVSSLYTSPWTCQAVLRGLPPLAKLYALRMVYLEVIGAPELLHSTNMTSLRKCHCMYRYPSDFNFMRRAKTESWSFCV